MSGRNTTATAILAGGKRVVDDRVAEQQEVIDQLTLEKKDLEDEIVALQREIEDLKRQKNDAVAKALQDNQQVLFRAGRMSLQSDWQEGVEIHSKEILDIVRESGSLNDQKNDTHWAVFKETGKFPEGALKDMTGVGPPCLASVPSSPREGQ